MTTTLSLVESTCWNGLRLIYGKRAILLGQVAGAADRRGSVELVGTANVVERCRQLHVVLIVGAVVLRLAHPASRSTASAPYTARQLQTGAYLGFMRGINMEAPYCHSHRQGPINDS